MITEVLLAVILGLLVNEMCDVSSHLARLLLRWAARRIPGEGNAERYEEEWLALLEERPGKVVKLAFASWMVIRSTFTMRRIHRRREAREQGAVSMWIRSIESLSPSEFESMTAALATRDGFRSASVVGGLMDVGIDVVSTAPDGRRIAFQCKMYSDPERRVGPETLQRLDAYGAHLVIDELVLITNGSLSLSARGIASARRIRVIDGDVLRRWRNGGESLDEILRR